MKKNANILISGLAILLYALPAQSQQILPSFTVMAANYKYLKSVGGKEIAQPVQRLQRTAASYDIKNSDYYEEEYETYFVSFYLPEGQILAAYDKNGKLIRTAEKYKNITLPSAVTKAVAEQYPKWGIAKDVYIVNYMDNGKTDKKYKLVLENGSKRIRIQVNEKGDIS
jgi:hypothetical protein